MNLPEQIISEYIESNFSYEKTSTGEYRINSIFYNDSSRHLYINPKRNGKWFDQHEHRGGLSFENFLSYFLGIPEEAVAPLLLKDFDVTQMFGLDKKEMIRDIISKQTKVELPRGLRFFWEGEGLFYNKAMNYMRRRGISERNISELGWICSPGSEYHNRIFIPFYEEGKIVYFIARAMFETKLRYKNPDFLNTKDYVFNYDKIEDELFIFEGTMDAMSLDDQVGTAILSADLGSNQLLKIMDKSPKRIIFVPDNDATGKKTLEKNIKKAVRILMESIKVKILLWQVPAPYKDFNEYSCATGNHSIDINECVPWTDMLSSITLS